MRYQETHKSETRRKLISQASIRLRRDGLNAVGLRTLVADAGVTHGAFYAHFPSKAKLVEAAIEEALSQTYQNLLAVVQLAEANEQLEAFVSAYLSQRHWESFDNGCIIAALAPEVSRESHEMRVALTEGARPIVSLLARLLPDGGGSPNREARATTIFAGMVGALQFARLYDDVTAVNAMLAAARVNALIAARQGWK
ncbi:TetR/AcrR family transcriptional regulator [Arenicella xantha]|uniref:TetR family transcriptional regulator n=1 Tax=Arenicella xantha TaxID=644221 RepID=A0A395JJX4_9GAMM|nr:TetR/AcrR family transcriptional regulator [Arenicella xantha]RBP51083.1 TetR family transcriptional regulator [Arenicella xantha]